jgi:hypothetical protein
MARRSRNSGKGSVVIIALAIIFAGVSAVVRGVQEYYAAILIACGAVAVLALAMRLVNGGPVINPQRWERYD